MRLCDCGSGQESHWENDEQGIPLCRTCPACEREKLRRYRPEVLDEDQRERAGYPIHQDLSYADVVQEPIEPEE